MAPVADLNRGIKTYVAQASCPGNGQEHRADRPRRNQRLPDETRQAIAGLYDAGMAVAEIAERLAVSRAAVSKYNVPTRRGNYLRWGPDEQERLRKYLMRGIAYKTVAASFGCSLSAIRVAVYRLRQHFNGSRRRRVAWGILCRAVHAGVPPRKALEQVRQSEVMKLVNDDV